MTEAVMENVAPAQVDVVVVGTGFAGVYAIYKMRSLGLTVRGFEAGSDVGGTWYWNKYPGARCDVESLDYSYGFSNEIQQKWDWSHRFSFQPDIQGYISHVAEHFDLKPLISFNTRVLSQTYDETNRRWVLKTDKGETIACRFCINATGNLTIPHFPEIPGLDGFEGPKYHSSRWPAEGVDFTGKRVAVFGTGATGIQIVPEVAKQAARLYVMQRSPNFSLPAGNRPLKPEEIEEYRKDYPERRKRARRHVFGIASLPEPKRSILELTQAESTAALEKLWQYGGSINFQMAFNDFMRNEEANKRLADFVRAKIRATVKDPETARKLVPTDHPIGSKRICIDTGYYETFNRDNVELISLRENPVRRFTPKGMLTEAGEIEVDALVFATGFDAITGALSEIEVKGRGGLRLADKWKIHPFAYLGYTISGFPNMFIITGPGSPSVKSNMVTSIEQHVELIADTITYMRDHDFVEIEANADAEEAWMQHVTEVANKTLYVRADSWYTGGNIPGKAKMFAIYVGGVNTFRLVCEDMQANGYRGFTLKAAAKQDAAPKADAASDAGAALKRNVA